MDRIDKHLSDDIQLIMRVSSLGRAARSEAGIKVRQPLSRLLVKVASERHQKALKHLAPQVLEEVNVKALEVIDDLSVTKHKEWPMASEGDVMVMLDTDITPELAAEGMAREIVRRLQMMRRSAGFEIADHITVYYQGDEYIKRVMADFSDYIRQETLSEQLVDEVPPGGAFQENFKLEGHELSVGVKKLG
jgi:isoleucyl-tRNA synthetase